MDSNESSENTQRPSWLTDEYIAEILRKGEDDSGIKVNNVDITSYLGKGENYASIIQKINITYTDGKDHQKEKTFILKSMPHNPIMQRFVIEAKLYDKELHAYKKLIPAMASLTEVPQISAQFYSTDREDIVILEDMTTKGFKMADRKKRMDLAHSILALKALARFHGLSFAVVEREPSIVDHFQESMYSNRMKEMNSRFIPKMYGSLASLVETWVGFERFSEKIRSRIDGIFDQMEEIISPKISAFNVLNHGDFWVNNMLFRYNETQEPEEVCLIDLQLIRYGSPALDLQYFFATSLADNVREKYEDILLEEYHKALSATLRSVTLKPITYSLEDLRHDFQEKAAFGFNMGCFVIGAVVADSSEAIDLDSLTEESIEDGSANPMEKMFLGKRFKDALQKLLLYYELKGSIIKHCQIHRSVTLKPITHSLEDLRHDFQEKLNLKKTKH
ncbi:hypothetical protein PR048_020082 [Dryococelus australis]|uniref:CHK kinase-like domain-containing protein n=1 Tax=Dryococelus australis TaxID=614101 RepID=A0ABQ9H5B8_9NEOP|nr:hypothetical protein PR048_020082 [Dryococelus australis]